jgi:plastocyanin
MRLRGLLAVGVLMMALALVGCGGGGGGAGTDTQTGPQTVNVGTDTGAALQFEPANVQAPANTAIRLVFTNNSDSQPHDLTFQDGAITAATSPNIPPGGSETLEFTTPGPGEYRFICTIHPGMEGVLTVQ